MNTGAVVRRADYRVPAFLVDHVSLDFALDAERTIVHAQLRCRRNAASPERNAPFVLDGDGLELIDITIDDRPLPIDAFRCTPSSLVIDAPPTSFVLATQVAIRPRANRSSMGLHLSGSTLLTQCEAEGFRKLTYFPDRPDVLATYRVTVCADREKYPCLLANGNIKAHGADATSHWVTFEDPIPKPSYLFALVAGDLCSIERPHVTRSGRAVTLAIYTDRDLLRDCGYAMDALERALRWDEERYGLEYDLDRFVIAAISGTTIQMENKGLNVFSAEGIVTSPWKSADSDYLVVERIIGHEYFHNWTGNRITCRDWFQLCLKEGLTRLRDQQFSCDMSAAAAKRIDFINRFRSDQFSEDAGPNAHAVQPDSYADIANFYTPTVYDKGAEIARMLATLLGPVTFRRGFDEFVRRHDLQAVTVDDFVRAMEIVSGRDLTQFRRWYTQAGTPRLAVTEQWDAKRGVLTLTVRQHTEPTPGQADKQSLHIPIAIGLLDGQGVELPVALDTDAARPTAGTRMLELTTAEQSFRLTGLPSRPHVSFLRGFSAPVLVDHPRDAAQLVFQLRHDGDAFCRFEASQRLFTRTILARAAQRPDPTLESELANVFAELIEDRELDGSQLAQLLRLPDLQALGNEMTVIDVDAIDHARCEIAAQLGEAARTVLIARYRELDERVPFAPDAAGIARRAAKNLCLEYLVAIEDPTTPALAVRQLERADNLTDALAALNALANRDCAERRPALDAFRARFAHDRMTLNKWLYVEATSRLPGTVGRVRELIADPMIDATTPNVGMALLGGFMRRNYVQFHAADGSGYELFRDVILMVDGMRPESSFWLMPQIMRWRRYDARRRDMMRATLESVRAMPKISRALTELVDRALGVES